MATWSEWFKSAKEKNIPLEKYLVINHTQDLERLRNSGLPQFDFIKVDGKNFEKGKNKIIDFCKKYPQTWIRVFNKKNQGERHWTLDLKSAEDVFSYIKKLNVNITDFMIQLFEFETNKFGGNIVSEENSVLIEIIEGKQWEVSRSEKPFFHGKVNKFGKIEFFEKSVPEKISKNARKIINCIKVSRNEFMKGYFEFVVGEKGKIAFVDYKTGFK